MKANKFFALVMGVLALASCGDKKGGEVASFKITPTSLSVAVDSTKTITATAAIAKFEQTDNTKAEITLSTDKKSLSVKGLAEGPTFLSVWDAANTKKTCAIAVTAGDAPTEEGKEIEGVDEIWPILLDALTYETNQAKIMADLRCNDEIGNVMDIWDKGETYKGAPATGKNYFGNSKGYTALEVVAPASWSGGAFAIRNKETQPKVAELLAKIKAEPDKYYFHLAMKGTTQGPTCFYFFGNDGTMFTIGSTQLDKGPIFGDYPRTGEWKEFDIPMSMYAKALAATTFPGADGNQYTLSFIGGNYPGNVIGIDAIYFYKKSVE